MCPCAYPAKYTTFLPRKNRCLAEPPLEGDKTYTPSGDGLLRTALSRFYSKWVPQIDLARLSIFNTLGGIYFLPVDKQARDPDPASLSRAHGVPKLGVGTRHPGRSS